MDVVDEQIDTIGRAFLGMTSPAPAATITSSTRFRTADYYALAGIFRSTETLIHDNVSTWTTRRPAGERRTRREAIRKLEAADGAT